MLILAGASLVECLSVTSLHHLITLSSQKIHRNVDLLYFLNRFKLEDIEVVVLGSLH